MLETVVLHNIFLGLVIFFRDSLINKKLKRTVFIQNRNFVLQYTLLFSFFKEMNTFIQKECVKWIKSDNKDIFLEKISILNKCCSF